MNVWFQNVWSVKISVSENDHYSWQFRHALNKNIMLRRLFWKSLNGLVNVTVVLKWPQNQDAARHEVAMKKFEDEAANFQESLAGSEM